MTDSLLGCDREPHAWLTLLPRVEHFLVGFGQAAGLKVLSFVHGFAIPLMKMLHAVFHG